MEVIIETAIDAEDFKTLVNGVKTVKDVADMLSGPGPFTVFAPTDAAFEKLPAGTLDNVLQDKEKLKSVMTYHIVLGKYMRNDLKKLKSLKTVQGGLLAIEAHHLFHRGIKIDDAQIIQPDIECSNGVIHVIDSVLMPK